MLEALPRKVLVATSVHGRYDVRIFLKQCCSIAGAGNDVTLFVQDGKGNEIRSGVKIVDIGPPPKARPTRIVFSPWRMYRLLRSTTADVIHFHDPELLPVGLLLSLDGRRVIYDTHEDFPRQVLSKHWIQPALRKMVSVLFELFENFAAKRVAAVVCATPFIASRFQRINPKSIDINNFPLLEEFHVSEAEVKPPFTRTLCYIGAITRERGISEVVDALAMVHDVRLIMCGPFESIRYEEELKKMPGWTSVDYRGIVSRDEVRKIMACSAAGIVTFLPGPNHNDSQPNKMFEYMSAGLPLIASNFPLWRQLVEGGNCGICVDPSSSEEIAVAIERLLGDEGLCKKLGGAGQDAVKNKFNWAIESRKLLNLYQQLFT